MKLMHLSDLHLGKKVNGFSMLEDQQYILKQIRDIMDEEKPDGIMIAGDVYDRGVPTIEAVRLFDEFLTGLAQRDQYVFIISGNHDSAQRLSFGAELFAAKRVFVSPIYDGALAKVTLSDAYGPVNVYLLPFLKPVMVRPFFPECAIESYGDAIREILKKESIDTNQRNVILAHQYVTGASRSDSEELTIGGMDNVDAEVFQDFDYVALGHLHRPQKVGRETMRYSGSPLKYSFSECQWDKSVTMVTLGEDKEVSLSTIPLKPLRDLREVKGTYNEVTLRDNYLGTNLEDYVKVTLTDEEEIPDAFNRVKTIYKNLMVLRYDNKRTQANGEVVALQELQKHTPMEFVEQLYLLQNNQEMSSLQRRYMEQCVDKVWNGGDK